MRHVHQRKRPLAGPFSTVRDDQLAETEGFEPSMRLYTAYSLSRGAPSASRSRFLREGDYAPTTCSSTAPEEPFQLNLPDAGELAIKCSRPRVEVGTRARHAAKIRAAAQAAGWSR